MVELGLLSFGALSFEMQCRAAKDHAKATARYRVRSGSHKRVAPASMLSNAVSRLVKNNAKEMSQGE